MLTEFRCIVSVQLVLNDYFWFQGFRLYFPPRQKQSSRFIHANKCSLILKGKHTLQRDRTAESLCAFSHGDLSILQQSTATCKQAISFLKICFSVTSTAALLGVCSGELLNNPYRQLLQKASAIVSSLDLGLGTGLCIIGAIRLRIRRSSCMEIDVCLRRGGGQRGQPAVSVI